MERDIGRFTKETFDVLVIGGGINGAAIAHMAALNGLRVALLEKGDFAGGTSSKSTKLIHGGLRYLENFELDLVSESLRERSVQIRSAPHLVRPQRFIIPVYRGDKRPLWMMRIGVWLYDVLSGKHMIQKRRSLTAEEIGQAVPGIQREGLVGGVEYSDAQMNDARLCLENVLSAAEKGACVANYVEARSLIQEKSQTAGVHAFDGIGKTSFDVRARHIVCAVGPWTNMFAKKERAQSLPQVRPTKGVHMVVKGQLASRALLVTAKEDRRVFFVLPWAHNSLIGTTDTDFHGSPDEVTVDQEDIDYLVREARRVLPFAELKRENIITTFAGLRPLVSKPGAPGKVSRKHVIKRSSSGIIYVVGGKYTTYRKIAEDVMRRLTRKPLVDTRKYFPVYGSGPVESRAEDIARDYGMRAETIQGLMDFYGTRFKDVLDLVAQDPNLKQPICACSPVIRAQIVYAIECERACTENDIVMRRLLLGYAECESGKCREAIRKILSDQKRRQD
jgi:glycerol-3-phosphate dehydrogenase